MNPVYVGMPPTDQKFEVRYGGHPEIEVKEIRCGGPCKDDYGRIIPFQNRNGQILKLQKAAALSLEHVETHLKYAVVVTGAWRSCDAQKDYYNSDPPDSFNRYAPPDKTAHTRGLAIDVSTALPLWKRKRIKSKLLAHGWFQARPVDEPWHFSFGIQV